MEPFFIVKVFQPLREDLHSHDPYRAFPDLDTKLYLAEFKPFLHVLHLNQIMCHFTAFFYVPQDIEQECVVRSLDQVGFSLFEVKPVVEFHFQI